MTVVDSGSHTSSSNSTDYNLTMNQLMLPVHADINANANQC